MAHGEFGEDLAVESDVGALEHGDELGIGEALGLEERAHADLPEAAEVALLVSAMGESVRAGVEDGFVGLALLG